MKKRLLTGLVSIFMVFMMSTMMAFANDTVEGNMTSTEFLEEGNENGEITLDGDMTLSDSLKIDAKNYVIDLNGHTLTFTKIQIFSQIMLMLHLKMEQSILMELKVMRTLS